MEIMSNSVQGTVHLPHNYGFKNSDIVLAPPLHPPLVLHYFLNIIFELSDEDEVDNSEQKVRNSVSFLPPIINI